MNFVKELVTLDLSNVDDENVESGDLLVLRSGISLLIEKEKISIYKNVTDVEENYDGSTGAEPLAVIEL